MSSYLDRVVATGDDRVAWLRARSRGVTATDAAKLATSASIDKVVWDKLHGGSFMRSAYLEHGRAREPVIAAWANERFGIKPSSTLYCAENDQRHLATPDGLRVNEAGELELCEIKTTTKAWRSIPRNYLRQVWWQQYVLGAERTLVVWEEHRDFVPVADGPQCQWVERDENQIAMLVGFANQMLDAMAASIETDVRYPDGQP